MKHHDVLRPIGKCKGCCLNLRTRCAASLAPKLLWAGGRCRHFGDRVLLEELTSQPKPTGRALARLHRRTRATELASEGHYNGVLDPGKMAGRAKRRRASALCQPRLS